MTEVLAFLPAVELGRRIARRELSPTELVGHFLARIARLDSELHCFITVTEERAREQARAMEEELARGISRGPLHGVPIGLKDLIDTRGIRTTAGSRLLRDHVPRRDAGVTERLERAGLVLLGKHNLHEFAYGTTNRNPHYGDCLNPWDRGRVAGGSSGGGAAAIAAGLSPLAIGTDTGGSIRIPVAACGVSGLKPTLGRVSRRGVFPLAWSLDHVGPMARGVEDLAALLQILAGRDPEDAWSATRPEESFARDLEAGVREVRIGVPRDLLGGLEPDVERVFDAALAVLEGLGARVGPVEIEPIDRTYTSFHGILASEATAVHERWLRERPGDYGEGMRHALEQGIAIPATDYVNARRAQARIAARLASVLEDVDVVATPTLPCVALRLDQTPSREPGLAWNRFLVPFNLAGLPAISIPCGFDGAGLPVGLQIASRAFDEAMVLRVARAYERETSWRDSTPPLASP